LLSLTRFVRYVASAICAMVAITATHGAAADVEPLMLTWTDNTDGTAWTWIERRDTEEAPFVPIAAVAPGVTTYVDADLVPGATYCYRAGALLGDLASPYSNEACAIAAMRPSLTLAVVRTGVGSGTVTSDPIGLACEGACAATFPSSTPVTLWASPNPGSRFAGWSGVCSGDSPSCVLEGTTTAVAVAEFTMVDDGTGQPAPAPDDR